LENNGNAMKGIFTLKSEFFSFGVLLLEIVSGTENLNFFVLTLPFSLITESLFLFLFLFSGYCNYFFIWSIYYSHLLLIYIYIYIYIYISSHACSLYLPMYIDCGSSKEVDRKRIFPCHRINPYSCSKTLSVMHGC
jgi:hypothetical protein